MCAATDEPATLLGTIFGTDEARFRDSSFMVGRGILTPKNADVDALNDRALQTFPGQVCYCMAHSHLAASHSTPLSSHNLHAQVEDIDLLSCCAGGRSDECQLRGRAARGSSSCEVSYHPSALRIAATPPDSEDRCPHHAAEENKQSSCKGTRLIVEGILSRVTDAEIATGNREDIGRRVLIPR